MQGLDVFALIVAVASFVVLQRFPLRIVVLYMLLGNVSIAAILVGTLSYRSFFTTTPAQDHALRALDDEQQDAEMAPSYRRQRALLESRAFQKST